MERALLKNIKIGLKSYCQGSLDTTSIMVELKDVTVNLLHDFNDFEVTFRRSTASIIHELEYHQVLSIRNLVVNNHKGPKNTMRYREDKRSDRKMSLNDGNFMKVDQCDSDPEDDQVSGCCSLYCIDPF